MTKATCKHFWKIEPPNGKTSMGTCKFCGESRSFMNSYEYTGWRRSIKGTSGRAASEQATQSRQQDGRFS